MFRRSLLLIGVIIGMCLEAGSQLPAQQPAASEQMEFFEKHIRPVLVKHCYECHSQESDEIQGGLTLDTREGMRKGGDLGPAVVPDNVRRSVLVRAINHSDDNLQMPPDQKLPAEVITNFERWIEMGAPDPREGAANVVEKEIDIEQGRKFWAFQPPQMPAIPHVMHTQWPKTPIDHFLLAKMEQQGIEPVSDAAPHVLLRRLHFDLVGLPPSPEEIEAFATAHARDPQAAIAEETDRLLNSPSFGERWGRHWLDVARYAESSGNAANFAYPHAWRYRDWVIDAFNRDLPYDEFVRMQLAGDLLPAPNAQARADNLVATGFLAVGPKSHNERDRRQFQMDLADEQLDTTFQAFQALTVACARCHDHKFDPIPQADYYSLAGIFLNTDTHYGTVRVIQNNHPSELIELPPGANATACLEPLTALQRQSIERQIEQQREQIAALTSRDERIRTIFYRTRIAQLTDQLNSYDGAGNPKSLAMGVSERRLTFDTRIYIRGELDQPGDRVRRGFPRVLTAEQPIIRSGSGRRELAAWMSAETNPLTARVMANRIWLHLIGRGLVATPDNFGAAGQLPSHPELLDHLAVSFMEEGWSIKQLVRSIVTSRVYQLSSEFHSENFERDPDNTLVWRIPKRRLEAEAIRDSMLAIGQRLNSEPPAGSELARTNGGDSFARLRGDPSTFDTHRSVYLSVVRDQVPEMLALFDFPDPSLVAGERASTTIPGQALFLMNNVFVMKQADGLGQSLRELSGSTSAAIDSEETRAEQITRAFQVSFSRKPTDTELNAALAFIEEYGQNHSARATWAAFCQALMASAEFSQR